jgi:wobble nucleotide-excising tRNase
MRIASIDIANSLTRFSDKQSLIFPNSENKIFIYGSNGSGKSSLSKLFYICNMMLDGKDEYSEKLKQLKTIDSDKELIVSFCYDNESSTSFNNNAIINPKRFPVFNKDYIDSKITNQQDFKNNKFKEQAFNYGVELESKTNYIKKLQAKESIESQGNTLKEEIIKKIDKATEQIRKDTSTTRTNKLYEIFVYENFIKMNPDDFPSVSELDDKRKEHIQYLEDLKDLSDEDKVYLSIKMLDNKDEFKIKINAINEVIKFSEDKTKVEYAKEYLDKFEINVRNWKLEGVNYINGNECPFCGNKDISSNAIVKHYKNYVASKSKKVEDFIKNEIIYFDELKQSFNNVYQNSKIKLSNIDKIFKTDIVKQLDDFYVNLNKMIDSVIKILNGKIDKNCIYQDCSGKIDEIDAEYINELFEKYSKLISSINSTNKKIYNSNADKKIRNDKYLKEVALFLVYNDLKEDFEKVGGLRKGLIEITKQLPILKEAYEKEVKEKDQLLKTMNEILDDFCITNYRIDEKFNLCLNNCSVSDKVNKYLSDGEKTIIAFALFLAELKLYYNNGEKDIIVIDDPISSVDYPNLYNIFEYIRDVMEENKESQIIITSHNSIFLNLFKFKCKEKTIFYKLVNRGDKTSILQDDSSLDSIYLEKLKEIFLVSKEGIKNYQKLYVHNYCRYVLETISRFEYPKNNNESMSSKFYIKQIISDIDSILKNNGISKNSLKSLERLINKGSHANIETVHDNEPYEDSHYEQACNTLIKYIEIKYNGQFDLIKNEYAKTQQTNISNAVESEVK